MPGILSITTGALVSRVMDAQGGKFHLKIFINYSGRENCKQHYCKTVLVCVK